MDSSIALGFQRPRFDPTAGQRNALAMRQAQMQEATQMMQMDQARLTAETQRGRRNALSGIKDFNDPNALNQAKPALAAIGDVDTIMALDNHMRSLKKDERDAATAELGIVKDAAALMATPETYGQGVELVRRYAPGFGTQIPDQYSPEIANGFGRLGLGIRGWEEKTRADRTATETNRHNLAMEARPVAGGVTINNASQTQEQKEIGKDLVVQYRGVRETADNAQGELSSLQQLRGINVQTGKLEELKAGIAGYAQALGIDPATLNLKDPTNAQSFIGTAQQLVLRVMQAQKGPQTENDAKRIEQTVANLGNTPAAKDFLIDSAMAVRQRDIERADFYDAWREQKGTFDGARKAWNMYIEKVPLLGNNPTTGRPVFFGQFKEAVKQANPGIPDDQVMTEWRNKYGRK